MFSVYRQTGQKEVTVWFVKCSWIIEIGLVTSFKLIIMVVTNRTRVIHISTQGSLVFSSYHFLLRLLLLL
jgi:hypothetical protein